MFILPPLKPDEILIYLRKSRADDPVLSVEDVLAKHEAMLDDWVERSLPGMGRIPEENRHREVVSGETIDSRPEVQAALRKVESPKYKAILCADPQRLSRGDLEDIGRLVKLLRYSNTIVITLQYMYDLRDEHDRDSFERELKRGNEFLEYQKRIMTNGRIASVKAGNYIFPNPPYGYDRIEIKEGRRTCTTLKPNDQAPYVRMIFEMFRDGKSSHAIARALDEMGAKTANGKRWYPTNIQNILRNEHYIGKVFWGQRATIKTVEDGEVVASRPRHIEYLAFPGKHEAIIDQELWDAVQAIRGKFPPVKKDRKHSNEFAGLIYCRCGSPMGRRVYNRNGVEVFEPRLACSRRYPCESASCTMSDMRDAVAQVLREKINDFKLKIKTSTSDSTIHHKQLIDRLEKRYEELNKLEIAQWEKYTLEGMPKHIFDTLNEKVLHEKEEVAQALCTAKDTVPEPVDYEYKLEMFSQALDLLYDPDTDVIKKNLFLKQCIQRIDYYRDRKDSKNRWGDEKPLQLDFHLKV